MSSAKNNIKRNKKAQMQQVFVFINLFDGAKSLTKKIVVSTIFDTTQEISI